MKHKRGALIPKGQPKTAKPKWPRPLTEPSDELVRDIAGPFDLAFGEEVMKKGSAGSILTLSPEFTWDELFVMYVASVCYWEDGALGLADQDRAKDFKKALKTALKKLQDYVCE